MTGGAPYERLLGARMARGEQLETLAERTGVRLPQLVAIEEGRFADLPQGIYARAAIRSYAIAYGLDPDGILAECKALLPQAADPIQTIARMRGVRQAAEPAVEAPADPAAPSWRPFAAAAIDALIVGGMLVTVTACAALFARVSLTALVPSAVPLAFVGGVLAIWYFVWFGGLLGSTLGGWALGSGRPAPEPAPLRLRAIAVRALYAATEDARAIAVLGRWAGQRVRQFDAVRSVLRRAPSPWPLRPHDPSPAPWSPENRPDGAPPPLLPLRRG